MAMEDTLHGDEEMAFVTLITLVPREEDEKTTARHLRAWEVMQMRMVANPAVTSGHGGHCDGGAGRSERGGATLHKGRGAGGASGGRARGYANEAPMPAFPSTFRRGRGERGGTGESGARGLP